MPASDPTEIDTPGPMNLLDKFIIAFLVLVFAFAGLDKVAHYHGFVNALNGYVVLPFPVGSTLAPLIIAAELAVAVGLAVRRWRRTAALQAACLMALLTIALAVNRVQGIEDICGCWFSINTAQGDFHFVLNGILVALCLSVWFSERTTAAQSRVPGSFDPAGDP